MKRAVWTVSVCLLLVWEPSPSPPTGLEIKLRLGPVVLAERENTGIKGRVRLFFEPPKWKRGTRCNWLPVEFYRICLFGSIYSAYVQHRARCVEIRQIGYYFPACPFLFTLSFRVAVIRKNRPYFPTNKKLLVNLRLPVIRNNFFTHDYKIIKYGAIFANISVKKNRKK